MLVLEHSGSLSSTFCTGQKCRMVDKKYGRGVLFKEE